MRSVADLLVRALRAADQDGRVTVRLAHLPASDASDLVRQTHAYALDNARPDSADGWLVFRDGIRKWWSDEAKVPAAEVYRRLRPLRADVVHQLEDEGLAERRKRQSNLLYVRRRASKINGG
jgi:hypothetical protein